jgi:hypothetical protein
VTIVWRKVNPYMLDKTVHVFAKVFQHELVDTKIAF